MSKSTEYAGFFYEMGIALEVKQVDDELVAAVAGVPTGFEIRLESTRDDAFRMRGGPLDGATAVFTRDAAGEVNGLRSGHFELTKISPDELKGREVTENLPAPRLELTPDKRAYFEALLQSCLERSDGGWVDFASGYPKHEFVQYATAQELFIFHGSNNSEITTFEPVRKSMELRDATGRGNLQAVYGTHDGLWAMFFAIVDRARLKGSIRNGVTYFHNREGKRLGVYHFSINQDYLERHPYTDGALYFLPRRSFSRLKLTDEAYANEWASEQPVRPHAKLRVRPEDFPFLERISGHDDSQLIRTGTIGEEIRAAATDASLVGDLFEVTLPPDAAVIEQLDEYVSVQQEIVPSARFEVIKTAGAVRLVITSLPPAVQQLIRDDYGDLLNA